MRSKGSLISRQSIGGKMMTISTEKQILIEQRVTNEAKSIGAAYLLWLFVGGLGGHRFYLGRKGSGLAMLLLTVAGFITSFIGIGLFLFLVVGVWALVDAFLIPGMVSEHKNKIRNDLVQQAMLTGA